MTLDFPLASRELARHGRLKRTYFVRVLVVGGVLVFMALLLSDGAGAGAGSAIASCVVFFQFLAAHLLSILLTSDAIAVERRERTLELLLAAGIGERQVLLGKFAAAYVQVLLVVLSGLPMLALAAFLGGVDVPLMVLRMGLLSLYAATACALGLLFSTLSDTSGPAVARSILALILWHVIDFFLVAASAARLVRFSVPLSPAVVVSKTFAPGTKMLSLLPGMALAVIVGLLSLLAAAWLLRRENRPRKARRRIRTRTRRRSTKERFWITPVARLVVAAAPGQQATFRHWPMRLLAALVLMGIATVPCVGWLLLLVAFHEDMRSSLSVFRRSGASEDVCLAGAAPKAFGRGILRGMMHASLIYLPAFAVAGLPSMLAWRYLIAYGDSALAVNLPVVLMGPVIFVVYLLYVASAFFWNVALACELSAVHRMPLVASLAAVLCSGVIMFGSALGTVAILGAPDGTHTGLWTAGVAAIALFVTAYLQVVAGGATAQSFVSGVEGAWQER